MRIPLSSSINILRFMILLPALCCVSCSKGEKLNSVEGQVLYLDQPMEGVLLTFHPKGGAAITTDLPTGLSKVDGTFSLMTGTAEGAPAGEYVVTAICLQQAGKSDQKGLGKHQLFNPEDKFKGAYSDESRSNIRVEIKNGDNKLDPINLK
jgi:hypothetical protein